MSCPEPDAWSELAQTGPRNELEAHLDGCADCRELVGAILRASTTANTVLAPELATRGAKIGRYIVEGRIGAGGMGIVLAAHDPQLERIVALKLVRVLDRGPAAIESARVRLVAEAKAMARLAHPNVVAVHEVVEAGDDFFIAMERVDGPDLATWLAEAPRLRGEALRVVVGAGRGIAAAHAAGLVHRDIKPANILIGRDGRARITDLGLAAVIAELDGDAPLAAGTDASGPASRLVGTPGYLAPEVAAGARGGARSDQYAFAITAWQAVFGNPPAAPPKREVGRIARVLRRALAEQPAERYPSITALVDQLERSGRPRWPRYVVSVVAIAAVALGIAWWRERDHAMATPTCEGDPAVGGVWSAPRRTELATALATRDPSPTQTLAPRTIELIDERARGWSTAVVDVCTSRQRGTQSAELADRRGACLEDQRHQLAAVLGAISDRSNAAQALAAVAQLARADACDDPVAQGRWNLPLHQLVRTQLAEAAALRSAGRYSEAMTRLTSLAALPKADLGLAATIAYTRADLAMRDGHDTDALAFAHEAVSLAERGQDDPARVTAMIALVKILVDLGRSTELAAIVPLLEAAAGRLPRDDSLVAPLENTLGNAAESSGNYADAERHYRAALIATQRKYGEIDAPEIAGVLGNIGSVLHEQGKLDDAREVLSRSVAMFEATVGPDHPDIAVPLTDLGTIALAAGQLDRAAGLFERVIKIRTGALGPDHPYVFEPTMLLGRVEQERGHGARALELFHRALALAQHGYGANHPAVAFAQFRIALLLADRDPRAATALAEQSVKIWDATGAVHVDAYGSRYLLAQLLWHDGAHARARALAEAARAGYVALGPSYDGDASGIAKWLAAHNSR